MPQTDPTRKRATGVPCQGMSRCVERMSVGTMRGTYQMVAEDGNKFDAEIPVFTLSMTRVLH